MPSIAWTKPFTHVFVTLCRRSPVLIRRRSHRHVVPHVRLRLPGPVRAVCRFLRRLSAQRATRRAGRL